MPSGSVATRAGGLLIRVPRTFRCREVRACAVAGGENCRCRTSRGDVRWHTMDESVLEARVAWALAEDRRAQLIDLRDRDQLALHPIPHARAIPLDELPSELATLDRERPVVLLSVTGRTAGAAIEVLRSAGITAYAVKGGVQAWLQAGLPTEEGSPGRGGAGVDRSGT